MPATHYDEGVVPVVLCGICGLDFVSEELNEDFLTLNFPECSLSIRYPQCMGSV